MSHLTTIMERAKNRIRVNPEDLKNDSLFLQLICNLKEYQQAWTDFTISESIEADRMFEEYKGMLIGTSYEFILSD